MNYLEHQIIDSNFSKVANLLDVGVSGAKMVGRGLSGTGRFAAKRWRDSDIDGKTYMAGMPIAAGVGMYARKRLADSALAAGKSAPKMGYGRAGLYAAGGLAAAKAINDVHSGFKDGRIKRYSGLSAGLTAFPFMTALAGGIMSTPKEIVSNSGVLKHMLSTSRGRKGMMLGAAASVLPALAYGYYSGKIGKNKK